MANLAETRAMPADSRANAPDNPEDAAKHMNAAENPPQAGAANMANSAANGSDTGDDWGTGWNAWTGEEEAENAATRQESAQTQTELPPASDPAEEPDAGKTMGLLDHLNELRGRLIKAAIAVVIGFAICWAFVDPLFNLLLQPLLSVLPEGTHAQYTTLPEAFFTRMYIAFVAGAFLASPVIFYQIWAFVAPGLYDEEKRYILPIAFLSAIFFIGGGIFCYYIVFPFAFNFFISYSTPEIVMTPKVSDYLSFTLKLIFAFGLIFEMPIFTFFLARLGILTAAMMRRARKYAIVGIFILAAILTPPDVVSQLLMACPMLLLYEISIGVAAIFGRKRKKPEADSEAHDVQA